MKDLGDTNHILGMHSVQNKDKKVLFLSQLEYIGKVLMHFNMERGKVWSILLPSYLKLSLSYCPKFDAERVDMAKVPYCSMVGNLIYAMICTRLDISYAVGVVNRYMPSPNKKHWEEVKGVMRYWYKESVH